MESPKKAWISPMMIVARASLKWYFKGITVIPFMFSAPTVAVKRSKRSVKIPPYITIGFPKNSVSARV